MNALLSYSYIIARYYWSLWSLKWKYSVILFISYKVHYDCLIRWHLRMAIPITLLYFFIPRVAVKIGMVVASHAEVARSITGWAEAAPIYTMPVAVRGYCQGILQLQAWVSANGVLKDCIIKVYLWYQILMKYQN